MKSSAVILGLGAALVALPAAAQLNVSAFYVGAGVGSAKAKDFCGGGGFTTCDDKKTAWKIFGGYQFNPNFAVEAGYSNFGKFRATLGGLTDEAKATAWEASVLGAWPIVMNRFSVFGRLGMYRATVKETTNFAGNFNHDNNDWTYGLGLQYDFTRNVGVRGEWQRYRKVGGGDVAFGADVGDKSDVDVLGLSALWRF